MSQNLKDTDPRDRIYGFIGLCDDNHDIIPDYASHNPASLVYCGFCNKILENRANLDIFQ